MNMESSNVPLYKIGTDWVFSISNKTGYFVVRSHHKVVRFKKAFTINDDNTTKFMEVPIGVIRKASHLIELHKEGKI